jgi:hypothetical protein
MYFSYQHGIPERYLNLVAAATASYKDHLGQRADGGKPKIGQFDDWRALHQDIAVYRTLYDYANETYNDRSEKLVRSFEEKGQKLLTANGYPSVDTSKPAICGRVKTGHFGWRPGPVECLVRSLFLP